MKVFKFFALATVAVMTVASCKVKTTEYEKLVKKAKDSKEIKALEVKKASMDSVSYLLGVNYGMMVNQNKFFDDASEMNMDEFKKGFEDAMGAGQAEMKAGPNPYQPLPDTTWAKKFKISPYEMNNIINDYLTARHAYLSKLNEKIGELYLAANKDEKGVQVTESGLQYVIHQEGEGDLIKPEDTVVVNYKGTLIDGTEFDANDSTEFAVNRVIPGWTEGLTLMNKGAKATLYIPAKLAYGQNAPRGSVIEPNSTLIFEVEVVDVIKYQDPEQEIVEIAE